MRLGVVSHSVLAARVAATNRKRMGAQQTARNRRARQKGGRSKGGGPGANKGSRGGDMYEDEE